MPKNISVLILAVKDVLSRALQKQREMAAVDDETGWAVARRYFQARKTVSLS